MYKLISFLSVCAAAVLTAGDITNDIPEIQIQSKFQIVKDVAQYKEASWDNVVGIAKNITRWQAFKIADNNPDITYFFFTKGGRMVLEKENGDFRVFNRGDAVFFSGEPWWGSAPGLADGYVRNPAITAE